MSDYALYRYFDSTDRLLYVGISGELAVRDRSHIARSKWMQLTARSTVERHATVKEVQKAERQAIEAEFPLFNRQCNDTPEAHARLRAYLIAADRLDLLPPELAEWQVTVILDASGWMQIPELDMGWRPRDLRPLGTGDH